MNRIKEYLWVCFGLMSLTLMYMSYRTRQQTITLVNSIESSHITASSHKQTNPDSIMKIARNHMDTEQLLRSNQTHICSQKERKFQLSRMCKHVNGQVTTQKNRHVNLLVDHDRKVAYCYVQKAGCSSWKTILANITSGGRVISNMSLGKLRFFHYNIESYGLKREIYTDTLSDYTKFMVVRHPLDRLVSAYRDKMRGGDVTFNRYAYSVVENFRVNKTNTDPFPTFEEFVRMIFSNFKLSYNQHWNSYFFRCDPCSVHYDYILKIETMDHDMNMFLSEVYNMHTIDTSKKRLNSFSDRSDSLTYALNHRLDIYHELSAELIGKIREYYHYESQAFGYSFDNETLNASCCYQSQHPSEQCCC